MAARKKTTRGVKAQTIPVMKCSDLKAAIAKEVKAQVKDPEVRNGLIDRIGGVLLYGPGPGFLKR